MNRFAFLLSQNTLPIRVKICPGCKRDIQYNLSHKCPKGWNNGYPPKEKNKMNSFFGNFKDSNSPKERHYYKIVYKSAWPSLLNIEMQEGPGDKISGVDDIITLPEKKIYVERKTRKLHDTGDIMLEFISEVANWTTLQGKPGWIEKETICNFLAYTFWLDKRTYLFDFKALQSFWFKNKTDLLKKYGYKEAKNESFGNYWSSMSCPVPIKEIKAIAYTKNYP